MRNSINREKLRTSFSDRADVTLENVYIGMWVRRGRFWRPKWRDDIVKQSHTVPNFPKPRSRGTVIGFTNTNGLLVGENTMRAYPTDRITSTNGPGWACVKWEETGVKSTYPIGAEGVFSLIVSYLSN